MYCPECGTEIPNISKFCMSCGAQIPRNRGNNQANVSPTALKLKKVFNFRFERNVKSVGIINEWLWHQNICITEVSIATRLNETIPLNWETSVIRFEIRYAADIESAYVYQMGWFNRIYWMNPSYEYVDSQLELWKRDNPNCDVVWYSHQGFSRSGGSSMAIFFLYRTKRI